MGNILEAEQVAAADAESRAAELGCSGNANDGIRVRILTKRARKYD